MASLGEGYFYFSIPGGSRAEKAFYSNVQMYRLDKDSDTVFTAVE